MSRFNEKSHGYSRRSRGERKGDLSYLATLSTFCGEAMQASTEDGTSERDRDFDGAMRRSNA